MRSGRDHLSDAGVTRRRQLEAGLLLATSSGMPCHRPGGSDYEMTRLSDAARADTLRIAMNGNRSWILRLLDATRSAVGSCEA